MRAPVSSGATRKERKRKDDSPTLRVLGDPLWTKGSRDDLETETYPHNPDPREIILDPNQESSEPEDPLSVDISVLLERSRNDDGIDS